MARTDNLNNFLTDVADAIRSKEGTTDKISASEFDERIENLSTEVELQDKEVTPTKETQNITSDKGFDGLGNVTVNPIPDEYIIPDGTLNVGANGDVDVTMFRMARVGVYTPPTLQTKEVTPSKEMQVVGADEEYDGLNEVTVNPIPSEYVVPSGTLEIVDNGEKDVTNYSKVNVNVMASGDDEINESYKALIENQGIGCTKLPNGITKIGQSGFKEKSVEFTELPETITSILGYGFYSCSSLKLTKLPSQLSRIDNYAFSGCTKITIKELPATLKTISRNAFQTCLSITELTILAETFGIGQYGFYSCSNLAKIVMPNLTTSPGGGASMFKSTPIESGTGFIYIPDELVEETKAKQYWSDYANQIKGISELPG